MPYKTPEAKREYQRRRQAANRDAIGAYYTSYYARNRERILRKNREWRARNPHNFRTNHAYRKLALALLLQRDGDLCHVCRGPLGNDMTIEHIVPIVAGGEKFAAENLALSHKSCNHRRPRGMWTVDDNSRMGRPSLS